MKFLLTVLLLFSSCIMMAQAGCPDNQASNYDASANSNDGSCIYPEIIDSPQNITTLPDLLREASGLEYINGQLWTHNDEGADEIYRIDSENGEIQQTLLLANSNNKDWEDLAADEDYIYIGDFGNNNGDRTNLRIYRVAKNDLGGLIANAEKIEFSYVDQVDFTSNNNNNDFDCEAFFYHNDSLHLFTKNWVNNQTRHYTVPTTPGVHTALLRDSFNIEGLITSADISEDGVVNLLGYTEDGFNFMWLLFDYQEHHYFSGNKRRIKLGTFLTNRQTEGIVFSENGHGFICSENFNALPQRLLSFNSGIYTDHVVSTDLDIHEEFTLNLFPNPFQEYPTIQFSEPLAKDAVLTVCNLTGHLIKKIKLTKGITHFEMKALNTAPNGWYLVQINEGENTIRKEMIKIGWE